MIALRTRTISALGLVQIFAWGTTYYLMAPLAGAIAADTGWTPELLSAGVSVALVMSGLAAPRVGTWIGRTGGRVTLSAGMGLISLGLFLLGHAQGAISYLLAWGVIGLGMSAGLYDAAFSVLGAAFGRDARSAITQLTLWGGFASTVCWPLSAWLVETFGWRQACLAYAALHLVGTLPLCWWMIPRTPVATPPAIPRETIPSHSASMSNPAVLCILSAGVALTLLATIWSVHMVTLLAADGYTIAGAIALGALIGPSQVGARVLEMLGGGRHHPIWTMLASTTLVLVGFAGLRFDLPAASALVAYGAGNGLWSIARGALPLALFGPDEYPALMGRLARPVLFAGAIAPSIGAFLIEGFGAERTMSVLVSVATIPFLASLLLVVLMARRRHHLEP